MNHPSAVLEAENKLMQLELARELGFTVPPAIVTSDPEKAWDFFEANQRQCVCKPGYAGLIATREAASVVYAWRVPQDSTVADFASVRSCPTLFQQEIKKISDVRVTAVGEELFAARILAQTPNLLDRHDAARTRFTPSQGGIDGWRRDRG
jgi:hypothetical protein